MNPELQKAVEELRRLGAKPEEIRAYIAEHGGDANSMDSLFAEQGLGVPKESLKLDVQQRPESTKGLPYDKNRPGDLEALKSAPAGLKTVAPEAAKAAAAMTLSAAQGVPGVRLFESAMGSLGSQFTDNPMSVGESRDVLDAETSKIPSEIRAAAQLAVGGGAGFAASRAPGAAGRFMQSPARAGGAFGAADQGLSANDMSLERRIGMAGAGLVGGATVGKVADMSMVGGRAMSTPTTGKNVVAREEAMETLDDRLYGLADIEGAAAGGTSPAIQSALKHPKIAPHAARVRETEAFKNATDAEVLTQVYRSLGRQQRALGGRIAASDDHLPDVELMRGELGDLKNVLAKGADPDMPTFRVANRAHADAEGDLEAVELGATAMSRAGMKVAPSHAGRLSQEAFEREFGKLPPHRRPLAAEGALGNLRDYRMGLRPSIPSAGGVATTVDALWRGGPLLRRIGDPKTRLLDDLVRSGMVGATTLEEMIRERTGR